MSKQNLTSLLFVETLEPIRITSFAEKLVISHKRQAFPETKTFCLFICKLFQIPYIKMKPNDESKNFHTYPV